MQEQMSLTDMFSDFFGAEEIAEAKEKKVEKKAAKKSSEKEIAKKITLPVDVFASTWKEKNFSIEGKSEATLEEIREELISRGYVGLKSGKVSMKKEDAGIAVGFNFISHSPLLAPVLAEEITIANGSYTVSLSEDELGSDAKLATVQNAWIEQYPMFESCHLIYDSAARVCFPYAGSEVTDASFTGTIKYFYDGTVQEATLEEEMSVENVISFITGVKGGKLFKTADNTLFVILERRGVGSSSSKSDSSTAKAAPKKEEKFPLPFRVVFTHRDDLPLSGENFNGKTEVTEKELQAFLEGIDDMYTSDKTEFIYFKSNGVVEARIKSSKRG